MKGCRGFTDREERDLIAYLAQRRNGLRNVALFVLGIETGFRISELLSVRLRDVVLSNKIRERLQIARRRMKRSREGRSIILSISAREALRPWLQELAGRGYQQPTDYLFQVRGRTNRALSRAKAWQIIHEGARAVGSTGPIGTHSLRKTFADRYYRWLLHSQQTRGRAIDPMRELQKALGHRNMESTESYIGWKEEILNEYIQQTREKNYDQLSLLHNPDARS